MTLKIEFVDDWEKSKRPTRVPNHAAWLELLDQVSDEIVLCGRSGAALKAIDFRAIEGEVGTVVLEARLEFWNAPATTMVWHRSPFRGRFCSGQDS